MRKIPAKKTHFCHWDEETNAFYGFLVAKLFPAQKLPNMKVSQGKSEGAKKIFPAGGGEKDKKTSLSLVCF